MMIVIHSSSGTLRCGKLSIPELWVTFLSVALQVYIQGEKKKVREKEKHKWGNGGFRLSCLFPLLLHQELVRHQGDEFAIGGLVVLAVDVVAEEGVEVFDAWTASRSKR